MDDKLPETIELEFSHSPSHTATEITPLTSLSTPDTISKENETPKESIKVESDMKTDVLETVEISEFAEMFVEPIMKEAIAMHKIEVEEVRGDGCGDKKSDKSSSDDGFEYVKEEEVGKSGGAVGELSEGEEVKRELEDVVFSEEMRLESGSEVEIVSMPPEGYESDEGLHEDDLGQMEAEEVIKVVEKPSESFQGDLSREIDDNEIQEDEETQVETEELINQEINIVDKFEPLIDEKIDENRENSIEIDKSINDDYKIDKSINDDYKIDKSINDDYKIDKSINDDYKIDKSINDDYKIDQSIEDDFKVDKSMEESIEIEKSITEEITIEKSIHEEFHSDKLEARDIDSKIEHDINGKLKALLSWRNPMCSAVAFSVVMFIELGLMMDHSIISLLAYSGLLLMIVSFLYKIATSFRLINTQSSMNCVISFNKEDIEYCVDVTLNYVDYLQKEIKSIAYVESYMKNVKVFAMLWVLTYLGQMFNLQSLIFIGSLLLFSIPIVYLNFQKEMDQLWNNIYGRINGTINNIKSKSQRLFGC